MTYALLQGTKNMYSALLGFKLGHENASMKTVALKYISDDMKLTTFEEASVLSQCIMNFDAYDVVIYRLFQS